MDQRGTTRPPPWAYLWWLLTGAVLGLGLVSLLTVGVFLMAGAAALVAVGVACRPLRNSSCTAAVAGIGFAPLYLAWLNRSGPGTVCEALGDGSRCVERWSPWPFVVVAVVLLAMAAGLVLAARRSAGAVPGP